MRKSSRVSGILGRIQERSDGESFLSVAADKVAGEEGVVLFMEIDHYGGGVVRTAAPCSDGGDESRHVLG
jgi:hypothetical protein